MVADYIWDTKKQQSSPSVYGFCDTPNDLVEQYQKKRSEALARLPFERPGHFRINDTYSEAEIETSSEFDSPRMIRTILDDFQSGGGIEGKELEHYRRILKKAELRILRRSYDRHFINTSKEPIDVQDWAYFGVAMGHHAKSRELGYLQSLSTLLKVNDFLVSEIDQTNGILEKVTIAESLRLEKEAMEKVGEKVGTKQVNYSRANFVDDGGRQRVANLGMFLQETHRSKAYLQNLVHQGLLPNYVLLIRKPSKSTDNLDSLPGNLGGELFDPSISEEETLVGLGISHDIVIADSCNASNVVQTIRQRSEDYFVFSGRGILKEIFESGKKIIHVHPGKLPEYRGSTCPFYSTLAGDGWWDSSFIMKPGIDQGEIVVQREFPLPGQNVDATRIWDPFTRSEVLVDTVRKLANDGFLESRSQDLSKGVDYYVIHPILEHIVKEKMRETI